MWLLENTSILHLWLEVEILWRIICIQPRLLWNLTCGILNLTYGHLGCAMSPLVPLRIYAHPNALHVKQCLLVGTGTISYSRS